MLRESRSRPLAQLRNRSAGVAPDTAAEKMLVRVIRFDVAYAPKLWPQMRELAVGESHLADRVHGRHDTFLVTSRPAAPTWIFTFGISIA